MPTIGETGTLYVSLTNLTSNPERVRSGTQLGTVVPVSLVYEAVPQKLESTSEKSEAEEIRAKLVYKIYDEMNLSTESELKSSSEFEFLSSTDPSKEDSSERKIRKGSDSELIAPIPGPDSQLQEVKDMWALVFAILWETQ